MVTLHATSSRRLSYSAFVAFAAFGSFWGVWGTSVPRIREQTGVDDAELGLALLFVGAGALPAMLLTGRALDRWGLRVAVMVLTALGASGVAVALTASSLPSLCVGLAIVGATSGATDVGMNSMAGRAEQLSGHPIISRASGVFSAFVVISSIATGALSAASAPVFAPFLGVAVLSVVASVLIVRSLPLGAPGDATTADALVAPLSARSTRFIPLLLVGALGALAFASENAHQSWGAVFLEDELSSGPGYSAIAPAVFAGVVAITRFSIGSIKPERSRAVLLVGAAGAAVGASVVAVASSIFIAAVGLVVAAAGTAALYPTLLSIVSRNVAESYRGRATSLVTTVSYIGFLLGPVYVGLVARAAGLRGAMLAVGALGVLLVMLTPPLLKRSGLSIRRRS